MTSQHNTKLSVFVRALGLRIDAVEAQTVVANFGLREDPYRSDLSPESVYFENEACGVALLAEDCVVDSIFLYSEGRDGFSQFEGALTQDLTVASTRAEVRAKLGRPSASSPAVSVSPSLTHGGWDRFDYSSHTLHFTYDTGSEKIVLVTLSRRP